MNHNFIKKRLQHRFSPLKFAKLLGTSPVAASDSFRFPGCNFVKKETPIKMFSREFCKIFKKTPKKCFSVNFAKFLRTSFGRTLPDDFFLCLSVNFEKFIQSMQSSLYDKVYIDNLRETAYFMYKLQNFNHQIQLLLRILYKNKKQPLEGVHLLKIPENYLGRSS